MPTTDLQDQSPEPKVPNSRLGEGCFYIFLAIAAFAAFGGILALLGPKNVGPIGFCVLLFIFGGIIICCMSQVTDSCPKCKKMGVMSEENKVFDSTKETFENKYKKVTQYDKNGRIIGYQDVPTLEYVKKNQYTKTKTCSHCGYSITKIVS